MLQRRDFMGNKKIVANQKMYMTREDIGRFINIIGSLSSDQFIVCPSSIYLNEFQDTNLHLGIQNICPYEKGAYTGEISIVQAKDYQVQYAIIGHSERRNLFSEKNEMFQKKIELCLKEEVTPIFCIGETKEQYEMHKTNQVLKRQLFDVLKNIDSKQISKIIIAYEPVWAIGTGLVPTEQEIDAIVVYIKQLIKQEWNQEVEVLYGGSVNYKNIQKLKTISSIDGFLVGGASKDAGELLKMYEVVVS